jgi:hypothetical protein
VNCRRSANNTLYFISETMHSNIVGMYVYRQQNIQPPPTTRSSMWEGGCLWAGSLYAKRAHEGRSVCEGWKNNTY